MPNKTIFVNGGRVTSKDESLLAEGELSEARDAMYKPNDEALWKVPGRTEFNSAAESLAPIGGRYLEFDGADDLIVLHEGTTLRKATVGTTGTFSNLETGLTSGATTLDAAHYNNRHFLFDGINQNRVVSSDGEITTHGMLANTTAPTVDTDPSTDPPTGYTLDLNSTMTYWVEERVKDDDVGVIKRNAENGGTTVSADTAGIAKLGSDATLRDLLNSWTTSITGDGGTVKPQVTRPAQLNSDATHWALFATAADGSWPTGAEIAEATIATTYINDDRTGTAIPSGDTYETVAVTLFGSSTTVPKWGEPPIATTGDVFEDALVTNDVNQPTMIRYSEPDEPDAFPAVYFIRFETKEEDNVTAIRSLGSSLIVFLRNSVWRVNTLPREGDSAFEPERVKSKIQGGPGCVSPMAVAEFSFGQGPRLAYVSDYGIVVTDGLDWDVLTDDMDWENTVELSEIANSVLVNNPRDYRLEFYYTPTDGSANTACAYLHYHPSHAKQSRGGGFRAKATWPITCEAVTAFHARVSNVSRIFTVNATDKKVFLENSGDEDDSTAGGIFYKLKTGDQYLNGVGGQARVERFFVHHQSSVDQTAATYVSAFEQGQDSWDSQHKTILLDRRGLSDCYPDVSAEAHQFAVENEDSAGQIAVDYLSVEYQPQGTTEAD